MRSRKRNKEGKQEISIDPSHVVEIMVERVANTEAAKIAIQQGMNRAEGLARAAIEVFACGERTTKQV